MIRALVCLKSIPDLDQVVAADWPFGPELAEPDIDYVNQIINHCDENAVEVVLRLRDQCHREGEEITIDVVTIGGSRCTRILRDAYALGADRCIHIESSLDNQYNFQAAAMVLQAFISGQRKYDLILCGESAAPYENGQTAIVLANLMGVPFLSEIKEICLGKSGLNVICRSGERDCEMVMNLPFAGMSGNISGFTLRMPTLKERLASLRREIHELGISDLGFTEDELDSSGGRELVRLYAEETGRVCRFIDPLTNPADAQLITEMTASGGEI